MPFNIFLCPQAGRAFTFLLDEKSKQKNQEKNKLYGISLLRHHPWHAFFSALARTLSHLIFTISYIELTLIKDFVNQFF